MKKNRYIAFGYTMRNGKTIIDHEEAEIVREIYEQYICGASLKAIADMLTERRVPYTEKTDRWDKARVARIIDNARYTGDGDYDPIIEESIYESAVQMKIARQTNQNRAEIEGISTIRNRVKCDKCLSPMVRHICRRDRIPESWTCTNDECGVKVRISDGQLLEKLTILLNRIIENSHLLLPHEKVCYQESPLVHAIQMKIDRELECPHPSENYIIEQVIDMASQMYRESQAHKSIATVIARRRVEMMQPQETFNPRYFDDIVSYITIDEQKRVTLYTKTETEIPEEGES